MPKSEQRLKHSSFYPNMNNSMTFRGPLNLNLHLCDFENPENRKVQKTGDGNGNMTV